MNTLVALSTTFLPGWPTAHTLSAFQLFMLCLGGPIILGIVVMGLGLGFGKRHEAERAERLAGLTAQPAQPARPAVASTVSPQRALPADDPHGAHAAH